jgi:hypothetical protein
LNESKLERGDRKDTNRRSGGKRLQTRTRLIFCGIPLLILVVVAGILLLSRGALTELSGEEIPDEIKLEGILDRKVSKAEYAFFESFVKRDLLNPGKEELEEKTKSMIAEVNAKYAIGNHLGLCEPYTYESMRNNLARENETRASMKASGEVFYGPVSFDEVGYFKFEYSNLDLNIVNELMNSSDRSEKIRDTRADEIQSYYEANIQKYEYVEEVTYELSVAGGAPEAKTADRAEMRTMYMTDDPLGSFLLNGAEGEAFDFETTTDACRAKILSVRKTVTTLEDNLFTVTEDYVTLIYYPGLVEMAIQMSNLKF